MFRRRSGIATSAIAVIAVVIVVIAGVGAYVLLAAPSTSSSSSSSPSTTSSESSSTTSSTTSTTQPSTVALTGCVFAPPNVLEAGNTVNLNFTGCLTTGKSGSYLIAATDLDGLNMTGTITAQYPVGITIGNAKISNLYQSAGVIYTANDTKLANVVGLQLLPTNGYAITVVNEGGQNNTVTLSFQLDDIPGGGL